MKMNYLLKNNTRRKNGWKGVIIPTLIFLLLISLRIFFPQFLSEAFFNIAQTAWGVRDYMGGGLHDTFAYFSSKAILSGKIETFREEAQEVRALRLENRILRQENASLRKLLGRENQEEWVAAGVIAKPPLTPFDVLILDAGKKNNISNGMMVVSGKVFLGKIIETFEDVSKAELFSFGGKTIEGIVVRTSESLTLTGKGGGNFEAEVPRSFDVEEGDSISLPGLETIIVADVLSIENEPTSAFKTLFLKTPVNVQSLKHVEIRQYTEW